MNPRDRRIIGFLFIILVIITGNLVYAAVPHDTLRTTAAGVTTQVVDFLNATHYYHGATNITGRLYGDYSGLPLTGTTIDTGQGAYELYAMDQNVLTSSNVNFSSIEADNLYTRGSTNITQLALYPQQPASYIIWKSGSTYYAKNGTDGSVTSNGNFSISMQNAVTKGRSVFVRDGLYTKTNVNPILIPSNTEIVLSANATIQFSNNIGVNATFFANSDFSGGNENIEIRGGVLDGNKANQGANEQIGIQLRNATNIRIKCAIRNLQGINIDVDSVSIYNWINPDFPFATKIPEGYDVKRLQNIGWEILNDFENATEWSGETGVDTVTYYSGSQSLYKTIAGGGAGSLVFVTTVDEYLFDPLKTTFRVKLRTNNSARISYGQIIVRMPDAANLLSSYFSTVSSSMVENQWKTCYSNYWSIAGSPNPYDVGQLRIYIPVAAGVEAVTIWVDELEFLPSLTPYGAITFTLDPSDDVLWNVSVPVMREYGIKGSLFIAPYYDEMENNIPFLKRLQLDGWDLGVHSIGSYLDTQTNAENEYYRQREIDYMLSHGFYNCRILAPLGGSADQDSLNNALEYYNLVRRISGSSTNTIPPITNNVNVEGFTVYSTNLQSPGIFNDNIALIDKAVSQGRWLIVYMHDVGRGGTITEAQFRQFLDIIITKGIPIVTINDILGLIEEGDSLFQKSSVNDFYMDVQPINAIYIRENEDLSAALPITFTIDNQPDIPRTLNGTFDSHAQITAYSITINGTDARDKTVSETFTESNGWTWETSHAYSKITGIKMTARIGTGVGDTMDIGITDVIGLSNVIYEADDIYKIKKNNSDQTVATAQINVVKGTYDMSVIGLANGDDFTIWYKSNLNIIK